MLHRRLSMVLISLLTVPAAAQPFGRPLTAEEVACEEHQLERLNRRFWVGLPGSTLLIWRGSPAGGIYRGLASTGEIGPDAQGEPARRESQLAFDLLLKGGEDFLNPGRPALPQAALVRRDMATNLSTSPGVPHFLLDLTFDLAPEVPDPSRPRQPIGITNRPTAAEAADDGAGRGLLYDDLLTPCHGEVSEFDLRILAILARTVRPSQCLAERPTCDAGFMRFKAVLFRGAEPLTYRMNVYPYVFSGRVDPRVAFLFRLQVNAGGRLVGGEVQALPWCTGGAQTGCTFVADAGFALFALPPLRPGLDRHGAAEFARAARLNIEYNGSPFNVLHDTVDWADLLRDTAWNEGLTASGTRSVQSSSGAPPEVTSN